MKKFVLLIFNIIMLIIGNCGGPLISRLYFIHGGKSILISSMLQTVACPIFLIPLAMSYFQRRKIEPKFFFITRQEFIRSAGVGLLAGLVNNLFSWGPAKLPVSTSTLIYTTQLAFTTLFAVLLVKQKLTTYSIISIFLLIASAVTLALRADGDRPAGESAEEYMLGFVMMLLGAAGFGLMLPLIELIYMKAKQAITYTSALEIQMVIGISATIFCTIGMIINKNFQAIPREAIEFDIGAGNYYMVLIWSAIIWQLTLLGLVGVLFYSSSLLCGIICAFCIPITEVFAVIFFHEKFRVEKGVAIFLALWGFAFYFYGENEQNKEEKLMENESQISQRLPMDQMSHVV